MRGGGQKKKVKTPYPTLKSSLRASQTCYYYFSGGLGKKVMSIKVICGGGGGVGVEGVLRK